MRSTIAKWGNSLAVRLPRQLAADAALTEGASVTLRAEAGALIIEPARPKYKLDDLLAQMREAPGSGETDWGAAQGREEW